MATYQGGVALFDLVSIVGARGDGYAFGGSTAMTAQSMIFTAYTYNNVSAITTFDGLDPNAVNANLRIAHIAKVLKDRGILA